MTAAFTFVTKPYKKQFATMLHYKDARGETLKTGLFYGSTPREAEEKALAHFEGDRHVQNSL